MIFYTKQELTIVCFLNLFSGVLCITESNSVDVKFRDWFIMNLWKLKILPRNLPAAEKYQENKAKLPFFAATSILSF